MLNDIQTLYLERYINFLFYAHKSELQSLQASQRRRQQQQQRALSFQNINKWMFEEGNSLPMSSEMRISMKRIKELLHDKDALHTQAVISFLANLNRQSLAPEYEDVQSKAQAIWAGLVDKKRTLDNRGVCEEIIWHPPGNLGLYPAIEFKFSPTGILAMIFFVEIFMYCEKLNLDRTVMIDIKETQKTNQQPSEDFADLELVEHVEVNYFEPQFTHGTLREQIVVYLHPEFKIESLCELCALLNLNGAQNIIEQQEKYLRNPQLAHAALIIKGRGNEFLVTKVPESQAEVKKVEPETFNPPEAETQLNPAESQPCYLVRLYRQIVKVSEPTPSPVSEVEERQQTRMHQ